MTYTVTVCGGRGPNAWDAQIPVEAGSVREALDKIEPGVIAENAMVVAVELAP